MRFIESPTNIRTFVHSLRRVPTAKQQDHHVFTRTLVRFWETSNPTKSMNQSRNCSGRNTKSNETRPVYLQQLESTKRNWVSFSTATTPICIVFACIPSSPRATTPRCRSFPVPFCSSQESRLGGRRKESGQGPAVRRPQRRSPARFPPVSVNVGLPAKNGARRAQLIRGDICQCRSGSRQPKEMQIPSQQVMRDRTCARHFTITHTRWQEDPT